MHLLDADIYYSRWNLSKRNALKTDVSFCSLLCKAGIVSCMIWKPSMGLYGNNCLHDTCFISDQLRFHFYLTALELLHSAGTAKPKFTNSNFHTYIVSNNSGYREIWMQSLGVWLTYRKAVEICFCEKRSTSKSPTEFYADCLVQNEQLIPGEDCFDWRWRMRTQ